MILKSIDSFGALTLDNGTSKQTRATAPALPAARANAITLPSGQVYDPYESEDIPPIPGKLIALLIINETTETNCNAAINGIVAYIGKRETLTGKNIAGTSVSASARLESLEDQSPPSFSLSKRRIKLSFQLYEVFS